MRKRALVIIVLVMLTLTGCINEYQLSEKGTDIAAEYMAGVLLENDKNYKKELLNEKELEEEINLAAEQEEIEATPSSSPPETPISENVNNEVTTPEIGEGYTISEVIGVEEFDIQFVNYKLYDAYPEGQIGAVFSLTPLKGNQLLVATFSIENITDKEQRLDLRKSEVNYQLDVNVGTRYKAALTLLENNLKYIDMKVGAGKKEEALLIYEILKDVDMKDINLIISNGAKTEIIDLK